MRTVVHPVKRTVRNAVAAVLVAARGVVTEGSSESPDLATGPNTTATTTVDTTSNTVVNPTTSSAAEKIDPTAPSDLFTRCGEAAFPLGTTDLWDEPLDSSARQTLDALAGNAEGAPFSSGYAWTVASADSAKLVLTGTRSGDFEWDGYAYASFSRESDGWNPLSWGTCRPETFTTREGYAASDWVLDPEVEPNPRAAVLHVLVMERSCANGQPPEGRDIGPVVETDAQTITVLVEHVKGSATCPGNPWYTTTLDLGEPIGDRVLIDGRIRPGLVRPWPPTQTSLDSGGDDA